MIVVFIKVVSVFAVALLGFAANKIGWLPTDSSKYLSKIVINIAAPCVIISSLSAQNLDAEGVRTLPVLAGFAYAQILLASLAAIIFNKALRVNNDEKGIYRNAVLWTNNGFMGFPVALAIFGPQGLFYQVLINCAISFVLFTYGIQNVRPKSKERLSLRAKLGRLVRDIISVPILALICGLLVLLLHITLPDALTDVLNMVGGMMTPLSMMVIGIQLAESKPKELLRNRKLLILSALRLLILPGIFFLGIYFLPIPRLVVAVLTLNIMLPVATVTVAFAEEYSRNAKLAAEITFITTLFAMLTIPLGGVFLSTLT